MGTTVVHGTVTSGFERVFDSFVRGFEKGELGAAVAAYVDGRKVVDLWGGWADAARTHEWANDTIVPTYSATKGMTATCAHLLVDRGVLDVDEPVAAYWPEFGQAGKQKITVRMVLSHQAGLKRASALDGASSVVVSGMVIAPEKRFDWETITDALARSAPGWEPGTRWEYHGPTFGYLVGEIVRRVDGRPLDVFFREEIAKPLGADFMISVGPEDDHRCAEAVGDEASGAVSPTGDPWMKNGQFVWVNVNSRVWRSASDGASTGFGSADGLARVYAALANGELDGVRLLRAETIAAAAQEQPLVHAEGIVEGFGLGYALLWKDYPDLPVGAFGHPGSGGSLGLADPSRRLSFGYVMNQMGSNGAAHLLRALYRSIDG